MTTAGTLFIAEIPFPNGKLRYRYARILSDDESSWVRHGRFEAFYENGCLADEGEYVNGLEDGPWRTFHANGQLAAEGLYQNGAQVGLWRYWSADGTEEPAETFSK